MEKIVSLAKRRGFIFPGSEIYGGLANSWDYGPLGVELKNNIKQLWWKKFVQNRDDIIGIDSALIMNPKVWEASGHVATFNDPLVECKKCNYRERSDILIALEYPEPIVHDIDPIKQLKNLIKLNIKCPNGGVHDWTIPRQFNLMFKTNLGPVESRENVVYLRPETAQGMFVDFKNVLDTSRKTVPFGIAQIGKAFRNEITPGNFIFRTREFEQMEIEYFIPVPKKDKDWQEHFEYWRKEMHDWMEKDLGLDKKHIYELEVPEDKRAHYSKRTIDFEYDFPFGKNELYGLAYRTDFDLRNHYKETAPYRDSQTGEEFWPHVIEPTWGVDRSILAVLIEHYAEDNDRVLLKLPSKLAPYKVAVFPLLANKPELVNKAKEIYDELKQNFMVAWDDRGNIGKRYYAQDEIGTPFCITVDFDSLEDKKVTVRNRDMMKQERVAVKDLVDYFKKQLED
ncbi:MAG: glycine--tRNA ligase [Parcubacteria group bacterium]|nr:glycine--tRNA ligase [Parcubacteria group bacterium]